MNAILGVIFAMFIGLYSLPTWNSYQVRSNENLQIAATAKQAIQFNDASSNYIQQNAVAIQAAATPVVPFTITVPMLQAANLLPASFSATNPFNQTWRTEILQPAAGNLQALARGVGGTALDDRMAKKIADVIGNQGGFIPQNNSGIYPGGAANAYGGFAVWGPLPTANYVGVAGGEIASLLTFNNGQLVDNRLYRNAVPGQPQLNTMNTPIIMGAGTLQVVNTACVTLGALGRDAAGKVLTCDGANWKSQGNAFWGDPVATFAALPACNAAALNVVRIVQTPTVGVGGRAYVCNGAGTWNPLTLDDNGNMNISGNATITNNLTVNGNTTLGNAAGDTLTVPSTATFSANTSLAKPIPTTVAVAGTSCAGYSQGTLAQDATGLTLSCQSDIKWHVASGSSGSGNHAGISYSDISFAVSSGANAFGMCAAQATCAGAKVRVAHDCYGASAAPTFTGNSVICNSTGGACPLSATVYCN